MIINTDNILIKEGLSIHTNTCTYTHEYIHGERDREGKGEEEGESILYSNSYQNILCDKS